MHEEKKSWNNLLNLFLKFGTVGVMMTVFSLSAQFILLKYFLTPLIPTYICVYIISVSISYILNSYYTFKSYLKWERLLKYFAVYLTSMVLGIILLKIYRATLPFENQILPFLVVPFTMSLNFILVSRFLKKEKE